MRLLILLASLSCALANVRVWQDTLTLPASEEGPPDPNPPFDLFATTRFNYPYTLRENIADHRTNHRWRAVRCCRTSAGISYTWLDKISGKPMFYANPSIKNAQIGYRGAWAAFGVGYNFPVSHNWVSMPPVLFAYGARRDDSASSRLATSTASTAWNGLSKSS